MNFGEALEALKNGSMVQREVWNGKDIFIYLVQGGGVTKEYLECDVLLKSFEVAGAVSIIEWQALQDDVLADDWKTA